jgi:hypothetical protein
VTEPTIAEPAPRADVKPAPVLAPTPEEIEVVPRERAERIVPTETVERITPAPIYMSRPAPPKCPKGFYLSAGRCVPTPFMPRVVEPGVKVPDDDKTFIEKYGLILAIGAGAFLILSMGGKR